MQYIIYTKRGIEIFNTQHRQTFIPKIDKLYYTTWKNIIHNIDKLLGLVSHKTKYLVPLLIRRPVLYLQTKFKYIHFDARCLS